MSSRKTHRGKKTPPELKHKRNVNYEKKVSRTEDRKKDNPSRTKPKNETQLTTEGLIWRRIDRNGPEDHKLLLKHKNARAEAPSQKEGDAARPRKRKEQKKEMNN